MRKAHMLKSTKGKDRPNHLIFFDTETSQQKLKDKVTKHTLKLGCAMYSRTSGDDYIPITKEYRITDAADYWKQVDKWIRPKTKTYLIAHNIVFDLTVLDAFTHLTALGWKLTSFYSKGFVSIFRWRKDTKTLIGLDNGNFFSGTLKKLGKLVDLPKLEIDFNNTDDESLYVYCRRDVEIMVELWRSWMIFLDTHKCGSFKVTVASTAFNTWRHRFMPTKVHIHDNELALKLERDSYKGGRVEVLYQGKRSNGRYHYIDVNNMYGYVLRENTYPNALVGAKETTSIHMLRRKLVNYAVVANVLVDVDKAYFPLKVDGHTCYPLGRFVTTLTTPELKLALDNNWIEELYSMAWYTQAPLFADYVDYFHKLRLEYRQAGNKAFEKICKLFINALYGKFGQRGFNQEVIGEVDLDVIMRESVYDLDEDSYHVLIYLAGQVFKEWKEGESFHSFPAIASHVTAFARLHLSKLLYTVPKYHAYYMDTDSLIVDELGMRSLSQSLDPDKLGFLKIERSSSWLSINAPKDYAMQGRKKIKGVSKKARKIDDNTYRQQQWIRLAGMIRKGDTSGYYTKTVTKHQARIIHSGLVLRSGWVQPFLLGQIQQEQDVLLDQHL